MKTVAKTIAMIGATCLLMAATVFAQMEAPKPGPEHKKLDAFAGSWTLEGNMKPGPMGSGGNLTENEKCEWMDGGFYLICRSDFKSAMGNGSGISFMGYSTDDKAYTYREFNSYGEFEDSRGAVDGNTWTWLGEEKSGDMHMKGRFTMKDVTPTSYTFTFEMSQDGKTWTNIMDGKATKK